MMRYQTDAIGAHFVDDSTVSQDSFTAYHDAINHRHADSHSCIVNLLALNAERGALFAHNLRSARRHTFSSDHFDAQATLTNAFDYIKNDA